MDDLYSFFIDRANELKKERKFEEALKCIDEAQKIKKDQKSPNFWYKRGIRLCEFGEYEKAVECFDNELSVHEKSYKTFFIKARILFQLKRYAEAIECFNKAAEESYERYLQNSKKAEQFKKARKYEKALIYTDASSYEKPLDDTFWHYKGLAFLKLKKYDMAASCFMKAFEIKNNPKILYDLAKCEMFAGNAKKSLEILQKSCKLYPHNKEKLKVDADFASLSEEIQFRSILGF